MRKQMHLDRTSIYYYRSFWNQVYMVKTMSHAVFKTFGVSLIVETQKFLKTHVQDKRLYTKWGYVPQQYVTSSAQDAEYANVVFHNKMPIPLQALLNLAKASRASFF